MLYRSGFPSPLGIVEHRANKFAMDVTMAEDGAHTERHGQIRVIFTTNFPDIELPESKRQLLVPTSK